MTSELLVFLSLGHASRIVKSACETSFEDLQAFIARMQPKVSSYNETQRRLNQQRHPISSNQGNSPRKSFPVESEETEQKSKEHQEKTEGSIRTTTINDDGVETTEL